MDSARDYRGFPPGCRLHARAVAENSDDFLTGSSLSLSARLHLYVRRQKRVLHFVTDRHRANLSCLVAARRGPSLREKEREEGRKGGSMRVPFHLSLSLSLSFSVFSFGQRERRDTYISRQRSSLSAAAFAAAYRSPLPTTVAAAMEAEVEVAVVTVAAAINISPLKNNRAPLDRQRFWPSFVSPSTPFPSFSPRAFPGLRSRDSFIARGSD